LENNNNAHVIIHSFCRYLMFYTCCAC